MIIYEKSFWGASLIFRANGSAIYKTFGLSLVSVIIFYLYHFFWFDNGVDQDETLKHPHGVNYVVSSISIIIIYRARYGYKRYWEACGAVHRMMSKWLDATVHTSVFHMQQSHYDVIKPPSYYNNHDLDRLFLKRDRERKCDLVGGSNEEQHTIRMKRRTLRSIEKVTSTSSSLSSTQERGSGAIRDPTYLIAEGRLDGGWGMLFGDGTTTYYKNEDMVDFGSSTSHARLSSEDGRGFASTRGGRTPALFLQELSHLSSLCNAVALATLRNIEGFDSPLEMYVPGAPWPEVDPDKLSDKEKKEFRKSFQYFIFGDRTDDERIQYNASRPLQVLGGISDSEIAFLQDAKGPSAKVTLVWHWLSEFITREHLAGSLGELDPAMISRLMQFLSDGMIYYNHARKIKFIPFPFPHAQLSASSIFVITFAIPLVMDRYLERPWLGAILTFLSTMCLAGMHEVARELENPFRNAPNDIPICTLQAMYNESLITMFAGYHPDHYWDPKQFHSKEGTLNEHSSQDLKGDIGSDSAIQFQLLQEKMTRQKEEIKRLKARIEDQDRIKSDKHQSESLQSQ